MNKISHWFTWPEATYLPSWDRVAEEKDGLTEEVKTNLEKVFRKLDSIRDHFNRPINVHVAFRPTEYNKLVKGAANSAHLYGMAVDFDIKGWDCDKAREEILQCGLLEQLGLRMEDNPGSNWIHLDCHEVHPGGKRFFKP
jgi:zinc D-Ala-D-Ala carboxypeptidase